MLSIGSAQASDYALGAGLHLSFSEYKGVDAEVIPAPIMNVETEHFYIHGLEAGGYLLKTPQHAVMFGISYMPLEFDAGDSDNRAMKQLDDRDASAFANLTYRFTSQYLIFSAKISGDIPGESNGILADASIAKRFQIQRLGITPVIGATWASSNFNDYYYGISAAESRRSGLGEYEADSSHAWSSTTASTIICRSGSKARHVGWAAKSRTVRWLKMTFAWASAAASTGASNQ